MAIVIHRSRHPPKDRTLVIIEHTRVNKTVYAILATLAVCGIIMATVFLAFNIKFRNQRYIKMSSPQLNNLIIIGCILTYTSVIFLGLDSGLSSIGKPLFSIETHNQTMSSVSLESSLNTICINLYLMIYLAIVTRSYVGDDQTSLFGIFQTPPQPNSH